MGLHRQAACGEGPVRNSGGGTVRAFDLLAGSKTVTGLTMARFAQTRRDLYARHSRELWESALSGRLRPVAHARFSPAEAARAHEVVEERAHLGKVVLVP
ncbi:zinc-binding dehydrogenase [Streptomyces cellulosae]|nr:zinc-binding dehydrogenase [Streptomyces cellulosae]